MITASIVYDGREVSVPSAMGTPAAGQLVGTPGEQLCELAGRICYDSLGSGRSSADYHTHILDVGHLSVYEHFNITVRLRPRHLVETVMSLVNRPGVWVVQDGEFLRVTFNLRCALEWSGWGLRPCEELRTAAVGFAHQLAPMAVREEVTPIAEGASVVSAEATLTDDEVWVSMYLHGSRGFSHEQVRHGDFTGISQRSTRYVDESNSPWVFHPLFHAYFDSSEMARLDTIANGSRNAYGWAYDELAQRLQDAGVDKATARKQARGAARGLLGNALATELIFSASIAQWKRMLRQRLHPAADGEIRQVYASVLQEFRASIHAYRFTAYVTEESKDGVGVVLKR